MSRDPNVPHEVNLAISVLCSGREDLTPDQYAHAAEVIARAQAAYEASQRGREDAEAHAFDVALGQHSNSLRQEDPRYWRPTPLRQTSETGHE